MGLFCGAAPVPPSLSVVILTALRLLEWRFAELVKNGWGAQRMGQCIVGNAAPESDQLERPHISPCCMGRTSSRLLVWRIFLRELIFDILARESGVKR